MGRRSVRVPVPRSGFAGFRFPREVIVLAVRWYRGTESFGPGSGARACFSWSMGCCPDVKHEGRTATCVTQQGRDLRKRMLTPDPGPKLSVPLVLAV